MNFQGLSKVETAEFYVSQALKASRDSASKTRNDLKKSRLDNIGKSTRVEHARIYSVKNNLHSSLFNIVKSFPNIESLPDFYQELIKITLDYGMLKQSLGAVNWCSSRMGTLFNEYSLKIKKSKSSQHASKFVREFFGRAFSVVRQIRKNLEYLENARKTMKAYPSIKTGIPSIAIAGFPNVGKSTLLRKLTPAKPAVGDYSFTTQSIMLGYAEFEGRKIQFLDIPGTLNRFDRMNSIEQQAYLAMKYVADFMIYIFDLTERYSLEEQIKLYRKLKEFKKPIIAYLSKCDIIEDKKIKEFNEAHPNFDIITDSEILRKEIFRRVIKKEKTED